MTYNKTKSFNHDNTLKVKVGSEVPEDAINLSYYSVPELEPDENVDIFNDLINKHYFLNSYSNQEFYCYAERDNKLHVIENKEDTFYLKDFVITDVVDQKDDRYYYKYQLKYPHLTSASNNVENTISLENVNGENLPDNIIDCQIIARKTGESLGLNIYEIFLFFSHDIDFDLYIKYNPKDIKIQKYRELVSLEKIYTETDYNNLMNHKNELDFFHYAKKDINDGYNIYAPVGASDTKKEHHNIQFTDYPKLPFTYKVLKEQVEESSSKGVAVSFVIDTSGSMGGTDSQVNNAVNNFIDKFTNPDDYMDAKFNIVYFDSSIDGLTPGDYFADEEDGIRCSTNSSGGTNIPLGVNKSISIFNGSREQLKGYKKNIILLTDGVDGTSDSEFKKINQQAHKVGIDKVYAIGMGDNVDTKGLKSLSDKYYAAKNASDLMDIYNEIEEECRPKKEDKETQRQETTINKLEPGYFEVNTESEIQKFEGQDLLLKVELEGDDRLKYEFVQMSHGYIVQRYGQTVPVNTPNVYLHVYTEYEVTFYSRLYCIKTKFDSSKIYAELDSSLTAKDNWYLDIYNGNFNIEKGDNLINYSIPEFEEQEFCSEYGSPYKKKIEPISTRRRNKTLTEQNLYLIDDVANIDGENIQTIKNITSTKEDGSRNHIISANSHTGTVIFYEKYEKLQIIEYFYKENWYKYNGYYDENGNFIHLDLNPRVGHFCTLKNPYTSNQPEMVPTSSLFNTPVHLYIRPKTRYNKVADEVIFENDETLFHVVGEKLAESHPYIASDIGNGYYEFEDVKLIATMYIKPYLNTDKINMLDTRSRGGGFEDIKYNYLDNTHKDIKPVFDEFPWNGIPYSRNSVVVLDLPKTILKTFTETEIREKVNKYLALGTLLVINYKD